MRQLLKKLRCLLGHKIPAEGPEVLANGNTIAVVLCSRCQIYATFELHKIVPEVEPEFLS